MVNFCFRITWISENSDTVSAEATPRGSFEVSADFQTDTLRAPQLRDKVYGIWKQMVNGGIKQEELTKALAYFSKSYLEDGDKADKWADKMANEVVNGCTLLNYDNYTESSRQITVATVNAFLRQMDAAKNVVKLIFR
jgi:predicted Zn-dependent peptidase